MVVRVMVVLCYMFGDELVSSIVYGIGIVFSIVGLVVLVVLFVCYGEVCDVVVSVVFGIILVLLYIVFMFYYVVFVFKVKLVLCMLDYIVIYLLIVGIYMLFILIVLLGCWGWSLFVVVWILVGLGSVLEFGVFKCFCKLLVLFYIGMGWIGMIVFKLLMVYL